MRIALHVDFEVFDRGGGIAGEYLEMGRQAQAVGGIGRELEAPLRLGLRAVEILGPHVGRAEREMAGGVRSSIRTTRCASSKPVRNDCSGSLEKPLA